jgi:hypothetical protein
MPGLETVSADDVLRAGGAERPVKEGTFLQRTGLVLATSVGALASVVTLVLVLAWIVYAPRVPVIPNDLDAEKAKAVIENYKQLQQASMQPLLNVFDSVVVKVLLPVFTSILGYIFGSQHAKN